MLMSHGNEALADLVELFGFLQDFLGGHGTRGFRKALKEAGPAFANAVSPLR